MNTALSPDSEGWRLCDDPALSFQACSGRPPVVLIPSTSGIPGSRATAPPRGKRGEAAEDRERGEEQAQVRTLRPLVIEEAARDEKKCRRGSFSWYARSTGALKIERPHVDTVEETNINKENSSRMSTLNVFLKSPYFCVSLTVGTLRTKWRRSDLHGRRGKCARTPLSPWGRSREARSQGNCGARLRKVPKAVGMLFSPLSLEELFQLPQSSKGCFGCSF